MNPQPKEKDRIIPVSEFRKLKLKPEKSLQKLKKDLDKVFNAYIRKRDTLTNGTFQCISCDEFKPVSQMNAGHFYAAGNNAAVRWDERNVNGQCVRCNKYLHGNLISYASGMNKKHGLGVLIELQRKRFNKSKILKFEVQLLIEFYKAKLKKDT